VALGAAAIALALSPPFDGRADRSLPVHMAQHVLLTMVAAPLLAAGLRRLPRIHPVLAWVVFALTGWVVHFTGMFEAAAEHLGVHVVEHALLLGTAVLFWAAVVGPRATMSHPLRLLYLGVAMPQNTFLALAISSAGGVLYRHYASGRDPLGDQRLAGGIMWVAGDLLLLGAVLVVAAAWARHEERQNLLSEQAADRLPSPRTAG
jgi:putative membrane protein